MTPYDNNLMNLKIDYLNSSSDINPLDSIPNGHFVYVNPINITINVYLQNAYPVAPFEISFRYVPILVNEGDSNKVFTVVFVIIFLTITGISTIFIVIHCKKQARNRNLNRRNINNSRSRVYDIVENKLNTNKEILDKMFINNIYKINNDESSANSKLKNKCTICLEQLTNIHQALDIVKLPYCKHLFHLSCIKIWTYNSILNPKCPNCNDQILQDHNIIKENIVIEVINNEIIRNNNDGNNTNFNVVQRIISNDISNQSQDLSHNNNINPVINPSDNNIGNNVPNNSVVNSNLEVFVNNQSNDNNYNYESNNQQENIENSIRINSVEVRNNINNNGNIINEE